MIEYFERNYGCNADGNHGIPMWFYDLEPSDDTEIKDKVLEELNGYDEEDYPDTVTIIMTSSRGDDVQFEVDVKDYV